MPDQSPKQDSLAPASDGSVVTASTSADTSPPPSIDKIAQVLERLPEKDLKAMISIALSKTSLGFGPDPEVAKIISESDMHQEDCRLKGYTEQLKNKESQGVRDHDFRIKKMNREFAMNILVLVSAVAGAGTGLYLLVQGHTQIGSNLLVASAGLILYLLKGNTDFLTK